MTDSNNFDVVIIGAGPAGLLAGAWMARTGVKTLIIDREEGRTGPGHADGLESRTLEILDSFGLGEKVWMESNRTLELCIWNHEGGQLHRESISPNCNPGLSRYQESTLGQGRIEQHLLDLLGEHDNINLQWRTYPISMTQNLTSTHPIELRLRTTGNTHTPDTKVESSYDKSIYTKYLLGCDGAHSWVRKQLGLNMEGNSMDQSWGVLDSIPVTDFPDIRKRCIVKSPAGNLMVIPREDRMVRIYTQLSPGMAAAVKNDPSCDLLEKVVQNILAPYHFAASEIDWSTVYQVGQRICKTMSVNDRIFLAGDAIHTHSPKAGQGMNVSMQDAYNLGWKLASVIKGVSSPLLLRTYQEERLAIAQRLISFDKRMCQEICSNGTDRETMKENDHGRRESLHNTLEEENTAASGLTVQYGPGLLTTPTENVASCLTQPEDSSCQYSKSQLAPGLTVGARIPSTWVLSQSDSHPWHLQHAFSSTGQWHLVAFGGDIAQPDQMGRVQTLGKRLSDSDSYIKMLNQRSESCGIGSVAAYLVHSAPRTEIEWMNLPEVFRPFDQHHGFDYAKVFADNESHQPGSGKAYESYGVSGSGCLVLLRPDQHIALITNLEDVASAELFLSTIMLPDHNNVPRNDLLKSPSPTLGVDKHTCGQPPWIGVV